MDKVVRDYRILKPIGKYKRYIDNNSEYRRGEVLSCVQSAKAIGW